jgi:hypothetical protein
MLVLWWHTKVGEDQEKDKEIVDAERLFKQISGEEGESCVSTAEDIDSDIEQEGQGNPESTQEEGFFHLDLVRLTMKDPQVED